MLGFGKANSSMISQLASSVKATFLDVLLLLAGVMEQSLLKVLYNGISSFLHLSVSGNINSEPVSKYYPKADEIVKLLKLIIDANLYSDLASDEVLGKLFEELGQDIEELRELIENWHLLSSKFYFEKRNITPNAQPSF